MHLVYSDELLVADDDLRASLYVSPHIPQLFHFVERNSGKILDQKVSVTWEKYKDDEKYIPTYRCVLETACASKISIGQQIEEWHCISVNNNTYIFEIHSDHLSGMAFIHTSMWGHFDNIDLLKSETIKSELCARFLDIYPATQWHENTRYFCYSTQHNWQYFKEDPKSGLENLLFLKNFFDHHDVPGFLDSVKWSEIDPFFCWPRILYDYPELDDKCDCHDEFELRNQLLLMSKHPFFAKYMKPQDWKNSHMYSLLSGKTYRS